MKIERKKRPTRLECALYSKEYHDLCVEKNINNKRCLEENSLNDNLVSMIKELIELNEIAIKRCKEIFKSSHRTRRPECKFKRLRNNNR